MFEKRSKMHTLKCTRAHLSIFFIYLFYTWKTRRGSGKEPNMAEIRRCFWRSDQWVRIHYSRSGESRNSGWRHALSAASSTAQVNRGRNRIGSATLFFPNVNCSSSFRRMLLALCEKKVNWTRLTCIVGIRPWGQENRLNLHKRDRHCSFVRHFIHIEREWNTLFA